MNKKNKRWIYGAMGFTASLLVLIYCFLSFKSNLILIVSVGLVFLLMTYIMLNELNRMINMNSKKQSMLLDTRLSELQNGLQTINHENLRLAKATYIMSKRTSEALASVEDLLAESTDETSTLIKQSIIAQNKAAKVMIKYNDVNTNKIISSQGEKSCSSTMKETAKQLNESSQALLQSINEIENQYNKIRDILDSKLTQTNLELHAISENITQMTLPLPESIMGEVPVMNLSTEETPAPAVALEAASVPEEISAPELVSVSEQISAPESVSVSEQMPAPEPVSVPEPAASADPNKQLSPEEIAALFASMG